MDKVKTDDCIAVAELAGICFSKVSEYDLAEFKCDASDTKMAIKIDDHDDAEFRKEFIYSAAEMTKDPRLQKDFFNWVKYLAAQLYGSMV